MLEIINYSKTYKGSKKAVDGLNLTVEEGDIYGFIGHNGAGKTTTIRSIVGILDFEEGDIIINGTSIKDDPIKCKKQIAYIPDNPDIYEFLTGIQYLNFVADMYEVSNKDREERIKLYAEKFELISALGDLVSSYSHGMKQKLVIISALIHNPKLLILDEPFVGLDPRASLFLKDTMKELCKEGCMIFFSTHVLDVAEKLCNKIAIIKNGKLVVNQSISNLEKNQSLEDLFMEVYYEE